MFWIFFSINLWSQVVVIPSSSTPEAELLSHLSQNPQELSFDQAYLTLQKEKRQALLTHLKKAQFAFLEGQIDQAQLEFQKLADLRWNEDWPDREREVIHFSIVRLAQLSQDRQQRLSYLQEALDLDPEIRIDEEVFPPPLVSDYKQILKDRHFQVWQLPKGAERFERLIINGRSFPGRVSFLRDTNRKVRITFLSKHLKPQTRTVEIQDLANQELEALPLSGQVLNCLTPDWAWPLGEEFEMRLLASECKERRPLQLPIASQAPQPITTTSGKSLKRVLRSPWLWAGVSLVATGLLIHHQQQNRDGASSRPNEIQLYTNQSTD